MALASGTRLGPYEILSPLGAGVHLLPLPGGEPSTDPATEGKPPAGGNAGRRPAVTRPSAVGNAGRGGRRYRVGVRGIRAQYPPHPASPPGGGRGEAAA
jgi:hypothetical protein